MRQSLLLSIAEQSPRNEGNEGEATPSIEAAKKIANAFGVSLDFLVGEGENANFDKEMVNRLDQIEKLPEEEKQRIYHFMDLIIRDHTAKKAYSN